MACNCVCVSVFTHCFHEIMLEALLLERRNINTMEGDGGWKEQDKVFVIEF